MAYGALSTIVTGTTIASSWGNQIKANFDAAFPLGVDGWTAWSPSLVSMTLGNGAVTARYMRVGRTIHFRFRFVLGTTSAMATAPEFTLPVAPAAVLGSAGHDSMGDVAIADTGTVNYRGQLWFVGGSNVRFVVGLSSGTYDSFANVAATVPMTWAATDVISATGTYEAAT